MRHFLRPASLIMLGAVAAILVTGVLVAYYTHRATQTQRVTEITAQARILASAVSAALSFDDAGTAEEYVAALQTNPEIGAATVYDENGAVFAGFSRTSAPVPAPAPAADTAIIDGRVVAIVPVEVSGTLAGTVRIETFAEPVSRIVARFGPLVALMIMAIVVVAVLGAAQAALTRTNRELARRSDELANANALLEAQIRQRETAEAALRQAQKMEALGQLTGGVAHDFNNLLAIIIGNLDRVLRRLLAEGDQVRIRQAIENATIGAQRAASLTRSLLAFARRQPLAPRPTDINQLVAGMSDLLRRSLGEQVAIETVIAGGLWRTLVDSDQLSNAILNLAINARDAMPGGGKLTIETANAHLDARYAAGHDEVEPGQYVVICVTDTGGGIAPEIIDQVFDPFFTTKQPGQGTGLGLSQVYGFVKQSGGHVKIYSEPGEGTTVKIYLPRIAADADPGEIATPVAEPAGEGHGELVLVVEDDPGVRAHSVEALRDLGYRVVAAATGAAGLVLLEDNPDIVLLFTDVGLPGGMNGRQLADEARRRRPRLKVLYTTGYARNAIVHDGRLDPGVRLVTKPFTLPELAAAVHDVLEERPDTLTILHVEDELLLRLATGQTLNELGFDVVEAANVEEALREIAARNGKFAAAIVDLGLPDRDGTALLAALQDGRKGVPVVIASGALPPDLSQRVAAGARLRHLAKPYAADDLVAALLALGVRPPR